MRASPSLDAEVARVIFRAIVSYDSGTEEYWLVDLDGNASVKVPPYTSEPHSAQFVVDHLYKQGWTFRYQNDGDGFLVGFSRDDGSVYRSYRAADLPLAICIAALGVANGTHIQSK